MSNPVRSLNAYLDWPLVAQVLNQQTREPALPTYTACPLCDSGAVAIYRDHLVGGAWYHCRTCNSSGDMIELAARIWDLSLEETIAKLAGHGCELPSDAQSVARYIHDHVDYRKRLMQLWQASRSGLQRRAGDLMHLEQRFNLRCDVSQDRWADGPGCLLGGIDAEKVERTFAPGVMKHADIKVQRSSPSEHAIFQGPKWREVLVLPFFDLPRRICSFLFAGRAGEYPADFVFRRANMGFHGNGYGCAALEAGLAMHPRVLDAADSDWEHTIVAVSNPIAALRLQMRHVRESIRPLPLVIWYDSLLRRKQHAGGRRTRTINAWEMLGNRKIVFWMPEISAATFLQAIAHDGWVSRMGPRFSGDETLKQYMWRYSPREVIKHILQAAEPWPRALSRANDQMVSSEAEAMFLRLQSDGADLERVAESCGKLTGQRLAKMFVDGGQRTAVLCGKTIIEQAGKWYVSRGPNKPLELISDAILRIDYAIRNRRLNQVTLAARAIYGHHVVRFKVPAERLVKQGMVLLRKVLSSRGTGVPVTNPKWSKRLVDIARLFHQPTMLWAVESVGWDDYERRFVLPKFAIGIDGISKAVVEAMFSPAAPARQLEPPSDGDMYFEGGFAKNLDYPTKLFWAVLACLVTNIIAPRYCRDRQGIGLRGEGAEAMGQFVAEAIGCLRHDVASAKQVRRALEQEHEHGWPILVCEETPLRPRVRQLLLEPRDKPRNLIVPLREDEAQALVERRDWLVVTGRQPVEIDDILCDLARLFVPAYLQMLCARSYWVVHEKRWREPFVAQVVRDMAHFYGERGFEKDAVLAAISMVCPKSKVKRRGPARSASSACGER